MENDIWEIDLVACWTKQISDGRGGHGVPTPTKMKHLVFVYGTLRSGGAGAMSIRFPEAQFVAPATVSGSLYDLGAYPGLLLDESNVPVVGEAYEVDDKTLDQLDEFEASSNYHRQQAEISLGTTRRNSWVYVPEYDSSPHARLITSGDWMEYAKTKTGWPGDPSPDEVLPQKY